MNADGLKRNLNEMQEKALASWLPKDAASLAAFQKIEFAALRAMMSDELPGEREYDLKSGSGLQEKDGVAFSNVVLSRKGQGERVKLVIAARKDVVGKKKIPEVVVWVHPDGADSLWKDGKLVPAARA